MKRPYRAYIPMPRTPDYNASMYYRLDCPFVTLEEMGYPIESYLDYSDPQVSLMDRIHAFYHSDFAYFYQPTGPQILEDMRRMNCWGLTNVGGEWRTPPSFVVTTDDNLFMVHPKNPAFRDLGIRMPDGRLLSPACEIGEMTDEGVRRVAWRGLDNLQADGKTLRQHGVRKGAVLTDGSVAIDVQENMAKLSVWRDICREADGVVCSTPIVETALQTEASPRRTFVSPNMVRFDHYEQVDLAPHPDEIRILWQGSTTHFEDFMPLTEVLPTLLRQYPHVKFIFWGSKMPWIMENIPTENYKFLPWCRYEEYKLRLVMIGHDISIAPLRPHRFNEARSAIKFYESTVMKQPAAFLGQRSGPYAAEVQDEKTGLLYDTPHHFAEQLSRLIENTQLRKELAANGKQWVKENRDATKLVKPLYEFLVSLREERRRGLDMPELDWKKGMEGFRRELEVALGPEADTLEEQGTMSGSVQ